MHDIRQLCYEITHSIVAERSPDMAHDFPHLFDALYEHAGSAPLLSGVGENCDIGQEAIDDEMMRDLALVAVYLYPVYRLLAPVVGKTIGDLLDHTVTEHKIRDRLDEQMRAMIRRWPEAEPWISVAKVCCERFLLNLISTLRKSSDDDKTRR